MAYIPTNWVNDTTELSAENMNKIEMGIVNAYGHWLLAVSDTEPTECFTGDEYYNTTTKKIYTAVGVDDWGTTGKTPETGVFYIVFDTQTVYSFNGIDLISVGGGAGGSGGDTTPIGTIEAYSGSTTPNGYLLCDGSAVSRTTYSDLFSVIGTTYGIGDGSTTFNLPDLKGRVIVMQDANDTDFDTLGETGGSKEMQKHNHRFWEHPSASQGAGSYEGLGFTMQATLEGGGNIAYVSETGTGNSGNLQPYIVLNYIIKVQKIEGEVLSEQLPVGTEVDFDGQASDIPIGWEEITNPDSYSTSEVKTNKVWIDNKPIYRKCFNYTQTLTANAENIIGTIDNIENVVNLFGNGVLSNAYILEFPYVDGTSDIILYIRKLTSTNRVIVVPKSTNITNLNIVVEYTKTTD